MLGLGFGLKAKIFGLGLDAQVLGIGPGLAACGLGLGQASFCIAVFLFLRSFTERPVCDASLSSIF